MRKVDSDAFNRKIYDKILELNSLVKKVSPENIKLFDADLINSAENYTKVLKECSWDGDSNFNGIEMHKIKDLIFDLKAKNKTRFHVVRNILPINSRNLSTGKQHFETTLELPALFDGRQSIVFVAGFYTLAYGFYNENVQYWRERVGYDQAKTDGGHLKISKRASAIDVSATVFVPIEYGYGLDVTAILWR